MTWFRIGSTAGSSRLNRCWTVASITIASVWSVAIVCVSSAQAQDCDLDRIAGLRHAVGEAVDRNFRCLLQKVEALQGENHELRRQLEDKVGTAALEAAKVPSGTVIALDVSLQIDPITKAYVCPEGWQPFTHGVGRMIIGAGDPAVMSKLSTDAEGEPLKQRPYQNPGGAQRHELKLPEIPSHRHPVQRHSGKPDDQSDMLGGSEAGYGLARVGDDGKLDRVVGRAGGDEDGKTVPHNIMPPYIALYFCTKE